MNTRYLPLLLIGCLGLIAILLVVGTYGDLLGARVVLKKGLLVRANVTSGDTVTLQFSPRSKARKVELCVDKKGPVNGYAKCEVLHSSVEANAPRIDVVIPRKFPFGPAVIISRFRDAQGKLLPLSASDEKIAITIKPHPVSKSIPTPGPGAGDEGSHSVLPGLNGGRVESLYICLQPDYVKSQRLQAGVWWKPLSGTLQLRRAGESEWQTFSGYRDNQPDYGFRYTGLFRSGGRIPPVIIAGEDYELRIRWSETAYSFAYRFNAGSTVPPDGPQYTGISPCAYRRINLQ